MVVAVFICPYLFYFIFVLRINGIVGGAVVGLEGPLGPVPLAFPLEPMEFPKQMEESVVFARTNVRRVFLGLL